MKQPFAENEESDLSLATWMGISGAAISTGLGQNTSLGLSLLAGLSNLRLGVWWLPGMHRERKRLRPRHWVPVQFYLLYEFLGWFKGPRTAEGSDSEGPDANRLYLTDGGHFENTGIYELVRRRVPLIVACDNGADPDYEFADVVNLTRKLRIDFDVDLDFLPSDKLDELLGKEGLSRGIFGEISRLVVYSKDQRSQGPYAAIARLRKKPKILGGRVESPGYLGTLILLKPRLSGLEMIDLLDYNHINQSFPQQSTGDQFFDEAQWESYFRLGNHIAGLVFADPGETPAPPPGDEPAPPSVEDPTAKSSDEPGAEPAASPAKPARWAPHRLEPISVGHFPWFADDWLPRKEEVDGDGDSKGKDKDCPPCSGAAAGAAASAAAPRAGGLGFWQVIAAGTASLGALGATLGISQSLTMTAVDKLSAKSEESVSLTLDEETRRILAEGVQVHLDADVSARLTSILTKLDVLIGAVRQIRPGGGSDLGPIVVNLQSIRALLVRFFTTQDPAVLRRLLAEVQTLRDDVKAMRNDGRVLRQLGVLEADLLQIERGIRSSAPRPNARSGQ